MGNGKAPCCDRSKVKRGPWSPEEDLKLVTFIQKHGHPNWRALPKQAGLLRCGKSCRLRWVNYLRPDLKRGDFTQEEEEAIIKLHQELGNKWSKIASHFPGRTDNEIKNVWNTQFKKRLNKDGDHNYNPTDKINENFIATSSSASILSPIGREEIRENIGLMKQEKVVRNDISLEYSPNPNPNPNLTIIDNKKIEIQDFPINGLYQENYEVFPSLHENINEYVDEPIDFEFWKKWEK